jgi:anti-sigma factor RsiW
MNSCPESEKIRALRSGSLSAEAARRFQSHVETCPDCRREMAVEAAIDRELAQECRAPEIETSVLRALKIMELADAEGGRHDSYKYLPSAALIMAVGFLALPYLAHLPTEWIGRLISMDRIRPVVYAFISSRSLVIGVGAVLTAASLIFSFPRFRKIFEL